MVALDDRRALALGQHGQRALHVDASAWPPARDRVAAGLARARRRRRRRPRRPRRGRPAALPCACARRRGRRWSRSGRARSRTAPPGGTTSRLRYASMKVSCARSSASAWLPAVSRRSVARTADWWRRTSSENAWRSSWTTTRAMSSASVTGGSAIGAVDRAARCSSALHAAVRPAAEPEAPAGGAARGAASSARAAAPRTTTARRSRCRRTAARARRRWACRRRAANRRDSASPMPPRITPLRRSDHAARRRICFACS